MTYKTIDLLKGDGLRQIPQSAWAVEYIDNISTEV